jgi:TolA-binding protein
VKRPPPRRGDALDELLGQASLDELDGPALPLGEQRALALVRGARERSAPPVRGKLLRFPKLPLIGIGVVVATSAAAAALGGVPRLLELVSNVQTSNVQTPGEVRSSPARDGERSAKKRDAPALDAADPMALASMPAAAGDAPSFPSPSSASPSSASEAPSAATSAEGASLDEAPASPQASVRPEAPEPPEGSASSEVAPGRKASAPSERVLVAERSAPTEAAASRAKQRSAPSRSVPRRDTREPRPIATRPQELVLDRVTSADSAPAADLLGEANRARMERRFTAALDAYRRVITSFPETRQAQIARVSAGDLELERGDPRAAEQFFSRAVRDADVGAEALFGLAEAYRAEQRVVEERRALVLFAQRYPSNPLAPAARRRLLQLGEAHAPK